MKVLHVSPSFHPAYIYGGPIQSVYELCRYLARGGCDVRVLTTNANGPDRVLEVDTRREIEVDTGVRVRYCRRHARHTVSPAFLQLLPLYLRWADIVHLTGVYSFPTIPTLFACRLLGKALVWSPRGAFQRWTGSTRLGLKAVWEHACRAVAPTFFLLHFTSEEEARESRARFPGAETVVLPNGVTVPERVDPAEGDGILRLLYLGRLDPKKGIENLLAAGHHLDADSFFDWSLTIAGSGEARYVESLGRLIAELGLSARVTMVGEVAGETKTRLFERTDVVVVPSHTENFGMVVAEALAHSVPAIASTATPWCRMQEVGCGLWVDNDPRSLAAAIRRIQRMPLLAMGRLGREWMMREFSWRKRADEVMSAYAQTIRNRERRLQ